LTAESADFAVVTRPAAREVTGAGGRKSWNEARALAGQPLLDRRDRAGLPRRLVHVHDRAAHADVVRGGLHRARGLVEEFLEDGLGAQWELRRALARADQSLGHYDASVRAHVDRRFPRVSALLGSLSNEHGQHPLGVDKVRMKGPRPDRMPGYGTGFRGCSPGFDEP
jgi:hypothetical protein